VNLDGRFVLYGRHICRVSFCLKTVIC